MTTTQEYVKLNIKIEMKKITLTLSLILVSLLGYSQESKFSHYINTSQSITPNSSPSNYTLGWCGEYGLAYERVQVGLSLNGDYTSSNVYFGIRPYYTVLETGKSSLFTYFGGGAIITEKPTNSIFVEYGVGLCQGLTENLYLWDWISFSKYSGSFSQEQTYLNLGLSYRLTK